MDLSKKDNYGRPRQEYIDRIQSMSDEELFKEAKDKIWLSAYASNNPRSDYHWQVDAIFGECVRRNREILYSKAHDYVSRQ